MKLADLLVKKADAGMSRSKKSLDFSPTSQAA